MAGPDLAPLDYHQTPSGTTARFAIASVCVAVGTFVLAVAIALTARVMWPRPQTGGVQVTVVAVAWLMVFSAPVVGMTLGALGVMPGMHRRGLALIGIVLNVAVFVIVFAGILTPVHRVPPIRQNPSTVGTGS